MDNIIIIIICFIIFGIGCIIVGQSFSLDETSLKLDKYMLGSAICNTYKAGEFVEYYNKTIMCKFRDVIITDNYELERIGGPVI